MHCSLRLTLPKFHLVEHRVVLAIFRTFVASSGLNTLKLDNNRHLAELSKSGKLDEARHLFDRMPVRDEFSWNTMISGYASTGRFTEAREFFRETPCKSSITWNSLIAGYCLYGCGNDAFELFWQMQCNGFKPTEFTVGSILGICSKLGLLHRGKQLHSYAVKTHLDSNVFIVTGLVDMYAKCNCILEAKCVFNMFPGMKSHVSWTAMLTGYSHNGWWHEAMNCFRDMCVEGVESNQFTFPSVLSACAAVLALDFGQQVHGCILKRGYAHNMYVQSATLDMYAKCGDLNSARLVFEKMEVENVVAWNSMIVGCVREGFEEEARSYFKEMHARGMKIDDFTFPSILNCFSSHFDMEIAGSIHCLVVKTGYEDCNLVANALVDVYGKRGNLNCALRVFNNLANKDVVSWTSLISGYSQNGLFEEALKLFCDMRISGIYPDEFLLSSILGACAELTLLNLGQQVHAIYIKSGCGSSLSVDNSLIALYAKCGCIEEATGVFNSMQLRSLISWTSVIVGYAQNGLAMDSIKFYEDMRASGVEPDSVTFIGLLSACCHAGLVEKGQNYFESMNKIYGIKPGPQHYACMIYLLARSGKMMEVEKILNQMVEEPDASVWKALLTACRVHGNTEMAEKAAKSLIELEPQSAVPYVSLANVYSAVGKWQEAARIRAVMQSKTINKEPGCSWVEMEGTVHTFTSADRSHPNMVAIYSKVDDIIRQIKMAGYAPDTKFDLHDVDEEGKELGLAYHSEKLAVAFGLLVLPPRSPVRVFKNIRVCGDCHTAMKFISEEFKRHIILRDSNRFHHFREGKCSCNDYW